MGAAAGFQDVVMANREPPLPFQDIDFWNLISWQAVASRPARGLSPLAFGDFGMTDKLKVK